MFRVEVTHSSSEVPHRSHGVDLTQDWGPDAIHRNARPARLTRSDICQTPQVTGADVSPATAVPLHQAVELLAVLCQHLADQPAMSGTTKPGAREKTRRPKRPR